MPEGRSWRARLRNEPETHGPMIGWLWLSTAVVVLDQITKAVADTQLLLHEPVPVIPMLNLTLMYNTGAAFSFLSGGGEWARWMFVLLAVVISLVIFRWLRQLAPGERWTAAGLAAILGGAVGNLIDRVSMGYVVDFIDVYYRQWHWPAFNIADSAITVGVGILVVQGLLGAWGLARR
jgi:signal peptidase II